MVRAGSAITTGYVMNAFLADVTRHLIQTHGISNMADTTIVVPTRRAMLFVKECFRNYMRANGLQGPVQLPQLTSLSQLFDDLSPRYKADEIQLVCTLFRVYCETLKPSNQAEGSNQRSLTFKPARSAQTSEAQTSASAQTFKPA